MPDTVTTNYELVKPEINGSPNTWGNKLNDDMDVIDTNMKRIDDLATDAVLRAGSGTDPDDYIRAVLRYKDTVTPNNNLDLAHIALLKAWITNASPIGGAILWTGTIASIPVCWNLADGGTYNGVLTPNLRDRFIVGAGGDLAPGAFGGAATHNHSGNTGSTTLTAAQIPAHTHGVNDPGHIHNMNDPTHAHTQSIRGVQSNYGGGPSDSASVGITTTNTQFAYTGIVIFSGTTGISIAANTGGGGGHVHTIASADSRPPYYALAYIVRTKFPWDA